MGDYMKKLALVLVFLLGLTSVVGASGFSDMSGHWSEAVVRSLTEKGFIGGYGDGTFRPNNHISRGEFIKLLTVAVELDITDWSGEHWAMPYVTASIYGGIVMPDEYPEGIDPRGLIPREEMAALLVRAQGLGSKELPVMFGDAEEISEHYLGYVAQAVEKKLLGGYPDETFRPGGFLTRGEAAAVISRILDQRAIAPLQLGINKRDVYMKTERLAINVVALEKDSVYPRLVFGSQQVKGLEDLDALAVRNGAVAAITGSFFDLNGQEPWGNIISGGRVVHTGDVGSTIGFLPDGGILLDRLRVKIEGSTSLFPNTWEGATWKAWGFNRTPGAGGGIFIYTRERGESLGFNMGTSVVVSDGRVVAILDNWDAMIPHDGYVINFSGYDKRHAAGFYVGQYVSYRVRFEDENGVELPEWNKVVEGVAAGPTLLKNGQVLCDHVGEKVNVAALERRVRTALGITADGRYLLVTTRATLDELARMLKALGARDALNLDGGGSSGLWFQGEYVTKPLRKLNNAIIFSIRNGN
jgi:hypothetical protein